VVGILNKSFDNVTTSVALGKTNISTVKLLKMYNRMNYYVSLFSAFVSNGCVVDLKEVVVRP